MFHHANVTQLYRGLRLLLPSGQRVQLLEQHGADWIAGMLDAERLVEETRPGRGRLSLVTEWLLEYAQLA